MSQPKALGNTWVRQLEQANAPKRPSPAAGGELPGPAGAAAAVAPAGVPLLDCYESAETKLSALAVRHGAVHLDRPKVVHMYMYTFIAFIHAIDKCIGSKAIF